MSIDVVRSGKHVCGLPSVFAFAPSTIVRCDDCGREWKAWHPGNPDYAEWHRPLLRRRYFRSHWGRP